MKQDNEPVRPKFHLARLDSTRASRASRARRVESRRAKWNLGFKAQSRS